jgi:bifunctional DNA-binding transcriptional regulator/antitoxin component of YhaV-PrlF toxin-antitoxin module
MKFEMKRKIDNLGRIVLPVDLQNYYGIAHGDTLIILPVRDGIQIANSEYFIMDELTDVEAIVTIDSLGRFIIPSVFRNQYHFKPQDILSIVPHETCMLIYKHGNDNFRFECGDTYREVISD